MIRSRRSLPPDRKFSGDRDHLAALASKALTYLLANHYLSATGPSRGSTTSP